MDREEFKTFFQRELKSKGFKKIKKTWYIVGEDILCGVELQKSNYGNIYYINYYYSVGKFEGFTNYPTYHESDIQERVLVMSKTSTIRGKHFITAQIEYEEYTEEELNWYLDKEFEERILPPIYQGKKYILDNLGKLYSLTLHKEEVMRKLQA